MKLLEERDGFKCYEVSLSEIPAEEIHDAILQLDFNGDKAELYCNDRLISDWFTTGLPWRVALKRHGYALCYTVIVYPSEAERYFELPVPDGCCLTGVFVDVLHEIAL